MECGQALCGYCSGAIWLMLDRTWWDMFIDDLWGANRAGESNKKLKRMCYFRIYEGAIGGIKYHLLPGKAKSDLRQLPTVPMVAFRKSALHD